MELFIGLVTIYYVVGFTVIFKGDLIIDAVKSRFKKTPKEVVDDNSNKIALLENQPGQA